MRAFTSVVNSAIQTNLAELGGRELRGNDDWRANEKYGVSVEGRRFVFSDLAASNRFDEFLERELRERCDPSLPCC